jgi:hypothetical protein
MRLARGLLGHDIDEAAGLQAPVEDGGRTFEHLDALDIGHLSRDRRELIVHTNTVEIIFVGLETAHEEAGLEPGNRYRRDAADIGERIVDDHDLLIAQNLLGNHLDADRRLDDRRSRLGRGARRRDSIGRGIGGAVSPSLAAPLPASAPLRRLRPHIDRRQRLRPTRIASHAIILRQNDRHRPPIVRKPIAEPRSTQQPVEPLFRREGADQPAGAQAFRHPRLIGEMQPVHISECVERRRHRTGGDVVALHPAEALLSGDRRAGGRDDGSRHRRERAYRRDRQRHAHSSPLGLVRPSAFRHSSRHRAAPFRLGASLIRPYLSVRRSAQEERRSGCQKFFAGRTARLLSVENDQILRQRDLAQAERGLDLRERLARIV